MRRYLSSIAPVTTVNATKTIPEPFRELHHELNALETRAGAYVNLSQLQLALRGLESTEAVIRVAGENKPWDRILSYLTLTLCLVLGVNGQSGARRLAKVLLADPLKEEQAWERRLADTEDDDGRALLIRSVHHCLETLHLIVALGTGKTTTMTEDIPYSELFPFHLLSSTAIR